MNWARLNLSICPAVRWNVIIKCPGEQGLRNVPFLQDFMNNLPSSVRTKNSLPQIWMEGLAPSSRPQVMILGPIVRLSFVPMAWPLRGRMAQPWSPGDKTRRFFPRPRHSSPASEPDHHLLQVPLPKPSSRVSGDGCLFLPGPVRPQSSGGFTPLSLLFCVFFSSRPYKGRRSSSSGRNFPAGSTAFPRRRTFSSCCPGCPRPWPSDLFYLPTAAASEETGLSTAGFIMSS